RLDFFLYGCSTTPTLHSFPTRRSSDLADAAIRSCTCSGRRVSTRESPFHPHIPPASVLSRRALTGSVGRNSCIRPALPQPSDPSDRKSTRLNSSHLVISYAVFCLKKKT